MPVPKKYVIAIVKQLSVACSTHTPRYHTCRCRSVDSYLEPMMKR